MNIEQRLQSARRSIARHTNRLAAFESGSAVPEIGELIGTQRLLKRAQRRLRAFEIMRTVTDSHKQVRVAVNAFPFSVDFA